MTWHYEINGVRHDNVTEDDITGLIVHGELTAATLASGVYLITQTCST